jgi:site-specific DNA-methyltransferase (adenine-specific)
MVLDKVFGLSNFQSEIIWHYRRWSNSKKGLLRTHQTILFYTKTNNFKFRSVFLPYSDTTNIDQILQCRARDDQGKTVYAYDDQGKIIMSTAKCGVPLGDVWEIPFLNPKAAERIGYPTQKPILLLERIIQLVTDPGDWVLDPFCGSGTTLVAAKLLRRNSIGMDISMDAINLAHQRLNCPIRTDSQILKKDKNLYYQSKKRIVTHLGDLDFALVPKNKGVDAILKKTIDGRFVFIRLQRDTETVMDAVRALKKAASAKGNPWLVVIQTSRKRKTLFDKGDTADVFVVPSVYLMLLKLLRAEGADPTNHIPL